MARFKYGTMTLTSLWEKMALNKIVDVADDDLVEKLGPPARIFMETILSGEPILEITRMRRVFDETTGGFQWEVLTNKDQIDGILAAIRKHQREFDRACPAPFPWHYELPIVEVE